MPRQRTRTQKELPVVAPAIESGEPLFEPRPFVQQAKEAECRSESSTSLTMAEQYGHHLAHLSLFPASVGDIPVVRKKRPRSQNSALTLQPKLTIGEPGDMYEQEADQMSDRVVNQLESATSPEVSPVATPAIRPLVQTQADDSGATDNSNVEQAIETKRGSGDPLPKDVRQPMERSFNADFSQVNIHTDGESDKLNQSLHSRAFTTKQDIFFRQGEYNPDTYQGKELLAHELTHVVQQNGSSVRSAQAVQRKVMNVKEFKQVSGDFISGPRKRVRSVEEALAGYHDTIPFDDKQIMNLSLGELRVKKSALKNLLDVVDYYLNQGRLDSLREAGTRKLKGQIQRDLLGIDSKIKQHNRKALSKEKSPSQPINSTSSEKETKPEQIVAPPSNKQEQQPTPALKTWDEYAKEGKGEFVDATMSTEEYQKLTAKGGPLAYKNAVLEKGIKDGRNFKDVKAAQQDDPNKLLGDGKISLDTLLEYTQKAQIGDVARIDPQSELTRNILKYPLQQSWHLAKHELALSTGQKL